MKSNGRPLPSHLTELEMNELTKLYEAGAKIADLKTLFELNCAPNKLYRLLPPLTRDSDPCPNCGAGMIKPRQSRNHSTNTYKKKSSAWRCEECKHIDISDCSCDFCEERQLRLVIAPETIRKRYSPGHLFHSQDLTLKQVVAVLALAICTYQENSEGDSIEDRHRINMPLAPNDIYGSNIIDELLETNLIFKYQKYDNLFAFDGVNIINQSSNTFSWNMPTKQRQELIDSLVAQIEEEKWPDCWISDIYNIANAIAIAECLAFYNWCSKKRDFTTSARLSLTDMISTLLNYYSVGQCQYIIYESAKAASDYFVITKCNSMSAAEYMLKQCKILGDESKSNVLAIPNKNRIEDLPRSIISYILYQFFLPDIDEFTDTLDKVKNKFKTIN